MLPNSQIIGVWMVRMSDRLQQPCEFDHIFQQRPILIQARAPPRRQHALHVFLYFRTMNALSFNLRWAGGTAGINVEFVDVRITTASAVAGRPHGKKHGKIKIGNVADAHRK